MNKLLKDFKTEDLHQLVKTHLYKDLAPVHGLKDTYVSEIHKIVVQVCSYKKHADNLLQDISAYDNLIKWAETAGREPLYIFSTQLGIWEFNLELVEPEKLTNTYSFNINKGLPILAWYPEFNSEDEWVDAAMAEMSDVNYTDPMEMDLEGMMEELLNYDGNLEDYSEPIDR